MAETKRKVTSPKKVVAKTKALVVTRSRPKIPANSTYATGRRKESVAKVWGFEGSGKIFINEMEAADYLGHQLFLDRLNTPLRVMSMETKLDFVISVMGGGKSGQADAAKLGIARVLLQMNENFKPELRKHQLLTRDSRVKERKKYGRRGARKGAQYRKR